MFITGKHWTYTHSALAHSLLQGHKKASRLDKINHLTQEAITQMHYLHKNFYKLYAYSPTQETVEKY